MPKIIFAGIFLVVDIILFYTLTISKRYKTLVGKATTILLAEGMLITTSYMCTLITNNETVMRLAYSIYFACFGWLSAGLLDFAAAYTKKSTHITKFRGVLFGLLTLDSISQLTSFFFHHSLDYRDVMKNGDLYLKLVPKWPFQCHLLLCYVLLASAFLLLIIKSIESPPVYRQQYITILTALAVIAAINAGFVFLDMEVDLSILAYCIGAIAMDYYTFTYLPRKLTTEMSSMILTEMDASVVLFDLDGNCVYRNAVADQTFHEELKHMDEFCKAVGIDQYIPEMEEKQNMQKEIQYNSHIYRIKHKFLQQQSTGGKNIYLGRYLIIHDITKEIEELFQREYTASHDSLTGLYNSEYFLRKSAHVLESNPKVPYCIIMINIYQFKLYNEVFGSEAGDLLLQQIGNLFTEKIHRIDIVYGRWDSDKFVICLPRSLCTAEKFKEYQVEEPVHKEGFKVVNYIGVYEVTNQDEKISVMVERAAIALNTVKGSSQHFAFFDERMKQSLLRENELVSNFRKALNSGEFQVYIQPQYSHRNKTLVGGEALVRWIQKDGTVISPAEFIPVLEKKGLITTLDQYIWERTCQLAKELLTKGMPTSLSVNLSAQDFYCCDVYTTFMNLIEKYDLMPKYIRLEITESEMMSDVKKQVNLIRRLQSKGFVLEMDDFGSGYSSLNTLKEIPVDVIKMDMDFLEGTDEATTKGKWIVEAVMALGSVLNIPVIAEGVEFQDQADFLEFAGCEYMQGYLYAKPMSVKEFIELRKKIEYEDMI